MRDIWGMASPDAYYPNYDPKAEPGEQAGRHRVEQGIATYKVVPPLTTPEDARIEPDAEPGPAPKPRRKK
jgi:hypothetical protein